MHSSKPSKRVLLIIVDALNSRTFFPALGAGKLPNFQRLCEGGTVRERSISIFPSLTPAATSTIITGVPPKGHTVFGFHWFDRANNEVAYYGDDFWKITELGFAEFFNGCLLKLNQERLSAPTIFEKLHESGLKCASLNFLMFQGAVDHKASVPLWFSWHPSVPFAETIQGPDTLFFGDFVDSSEKLEEDAPARKSGIFGRFGFNDSNTRRLLQFLAEHDDLPDFTLAYFPDHDYNCHDVGPTEGASTLVSVDEALGDFIQACGGWEEALEKFTLVVTGDHAQSDVFQDAEEATITAQNLFENLTFSNVEGWQEGELLKVFPDMRCAQVYLRTSDHRLRGEVVRRLLEEKRIDQVIWRDGEEFFVATADRGELRFWLGEGVEDVFGERWDFEGDLSAVDARVEADRLEFGTYPNAFERIVGALDHPSSADLWLTARLGYEFSNHQGETHAGGGSHGSLHRFDSESPLLVSDPALDAQLPPVTRLVDVERLCRTLLGVYMP